MNNLISRRLLKEYLEKAWQQSSDLNAVKILEIVDSVPTVNRQLQLLETLKDRPCEACAHHSPDGCHKWTCVFDEVLT